VAEAEQYDFDVALSFAGENRETVAAIAQCLKAHGVRVFYDDFEKTNLWGKDLQAHLVKVYMHWARYAVVFVSASYRDKVWTRHELKAVLARALEERGEYVLPVRLDDTKLEGLLPTIGYLDLRQSTPREVCIRICEKLGVGSRGRKADAVPSPWSPQLSGSVNFDYSNHNGRYRLGQGVYEFETKWSKASDVSIYCLNNPPSIRGVAVAPVGRDVADVDDAASLDYSSRVRSPRLGQVVVLENVNGFFAALRLTSIKDSTRWDGPDELAFDYWILRDGGRDFSAALNSRPLGPRKTAIDETT
jgi:hypothetical protein